MKSPLERCHELAAEIARTGDFSKKYELDSLACDNEIFVCIDDEYVAVEDDVYYFSF